MHLQLLLAQTPNAAHKGAFLKTLNNLHRFFKKSEASQMCLKVAGVMKLFFLILVAGKASHNALCTLFCNMWQCDVLSTSQSMTGSAFKMLINSLPLTGSPKLALSYLIFLRGTGAVAPHATGNWNKPIMGIWSSAV